MSSSEYNDIFGYKVYRPPAEENVPVISDLNCYGEVVTLIDPNADVIKDPAVQKILKGLDGERTVKIEDLAPDVRYDQWNKKSQYSRRDIHPSRQPQDERAQSSAGVEVQQHVPQPRGPATSANLLDNDPRDIQRGQDSALREARQQAGEAKSRDQAFFGQLAETRAKLEKEIHRQLVEQLTLRAQKKSVTPEQQSLIEKLYLDLRLINPELAFATLKASALMESGEEPPEAIN